MQHKTLNIAHHSDKSLTNPVPLESRMKVNFRVKRWATNLQKLVVGFSMYPYIWVTRSRTISFLISEVNCLFFIALIIDGRHLLGIVKLSVNFEGMELLLATDTVDAIDLLGETDRTVGDTDGVLTFTAIDEGDWPSESCTSAGTDEIYMYSCCGSEFLIDDNKEFWSLLHDKHNIKDDSVQTS